MSILNKQFTFKRNIKQMTRKDFIILSNSLIFLYIISSAFGEIINKIGILGIGNNLTTIGFLTIFICLLKKEYRQYIVKYINNKIINY